MSARPHRIRSRIRAIAPRTAGAACVALFAGVVFAGPSFAEGIAPADPGFEQLWSATLMGQLRVVTGPGQVDGTGSFFDQYTFTPNADTALPAEIGISEARYDLLDARGAPRLRFRLDSPTSNLGLSGSEIDQPFLNQRGLLLYDMKGVDFEIDYHRFRTEELRQYPNVTGVLGFSDLTDPNDRFQHDRTGFETQLRFRPYEMLARDTPGNSERLEWLDPEFAVRGGYESRGGQRQFRFLLDPSNSWLGTTQPMDQGVAKVGGGVAVEPGNRFGLSFDFDYERFRQKSDTIWDDDFGPAYVGRGRPVDLIPDTDRSTATLRMDTRVGPRTRLAGGFQASILEQANALTPELIAVGFEDNTLRYYSANALTEVQLSHRLSTSLTFTYDRRDNELSRDPSAPALVNSIPVDPVLRRWRRFVGGGEVAFRPGRRSQIFVGGRVEWIDRDLDYATTGVGNKTILPENALIHEETLVWRTYLRGRWRPLRGLSLWGEVGYQGAPKTGYITDLDAYIDGQLRVNYSFSLGRPLLLSGFVQAAHGENDAFTMTSGQGPMPSGAQIDRDFERSSYLWGLSLHASMTPRTSLFTSFYQSRDSQGYELVLSDLQRYYQEQLAITFVDDGPVDNRNDHVGFVIGTHQDFDARTDGNVAYAFSHAEATYQTSPSTTQTALIRDDRVVDSNVHVVDVGAGRWFRPGLRGFVHYRYARFDDDSPIPTSPGSSVAPHDQSANQHTITFGVTLTDSFRR